MKTVHAEVLRHMLDAVNARHYSVLLENEGHWTSFHAWCRDNGDAMRLMTDAMKRWETFCLDDESQLYCIAVSLDTIETVIRMLVEAYEDRVLEHLFAEA